MKKLLPLAAAAVTAFSVFSAPVQSAQLSVDVDITLPEILILYCYQAVNVDVSAAQLATLMSESGLTFAAEGSGSGQAATSALTLSPTAVTPDTVTTTDVDVDLDATTDAGATLANPTLNLNNVCAVRGLVTGGSVNVTIPTSPASLANGASSIGTTNWTGPGSVTVGLGTPTAINISADLNLSGVTLPGTHSSATALVVSAAIP